MIGLLLIAGLAHYHLSLDVRSRFWDDLLARSGGSTNYRFALQPVIAAIAALHDGISDARLGNDSFFWSRRFDQTHQSDRLYEGLMSIAAVLLLGICTDVIYQLKEQDTFYPAEAAVIAIVLAVVPYCILRRMVEIIVRY